MICGESPSVGRCTMPTKPRRVCNFLASLLLQDTRTRSVTNCQFYPVCNVPVVRCKLFRAQQTQPSMYLHVKLKHEPHCAPSRYDARCANRGSLQHIVSLTTAYHLRLENVDLHVSRESTLMQNPLHEREHIVR